MSIADFIRDTVIEKLEDKYDLECYEKSLEEYKLNPKTYTLDEVKKEVEM